ncbi:MAG: 50S ribosomal protein L29 ['Candidatus Kapabacteria' thiocyanatum]|uniref:Large ribosomal subunit protein uL29 n=1 Tax=Candidatus Kapaibacterium thiocyanatum TaxID=1895771 RepID=A0A1M3KWP5_9BACT|nr:50S ribosomal protein L29 ['Candidatus Kapabacteria' thiocyanatum]OJX56694.1 MAG: 50S ribosomal protein L29 ['Candidatus Kapabacteria' thiocyanatum]
MKARKAEDLRGLPTHELDTFLKESEENVTRLRFQLTLGQLQDTSSIRTLRKDIARMKTILQERKNNAN